MSFFAELVQFIIALLKPEKARPFVAPTLVGNYVMVRGRRYVPFDVTHNPAAALKVLPEDGIYVVLHEKITGLDGRDWHVPVKSIILVPPSSASIMEGYGTRPDLRTLRKLTFNVHSDVTIV